MTIMHQLAWLLPMQLNCQFILLLKRPLTHYWSSPLSSRIARVFKTWLNLRLFDMYMYVAASNDVRTRMAAISVINYWIERSRLWTKLLSRPSSGIWARNSNWRLFECKSLYFHTCMKVHRIPKGITFRIDFPINLNLLYTVVVCICFNF